MRFCRDGMHSVSTGFPRVHCLKFFFAEKSACFSKPSHRNIGFKTAADAGDSVRHPAFRRESEFFIKFDGFRVAFPGNQFDAQNVGTIFCRLPHQFRKQRFSDSETLKIGMNGNRQLT